MPLSLDLPDRTFELLLIKNESFRATNSLHLDHGCDTDGILGRHRTKGCLEKSDEKTAVSSFRDSRWPDGTSRPETCAPATENNGALESRDRYIV
jgi:hypothetical protein